MTTRHLRNDGKEKQARNQLLRQYAKGNPELSYTQIGAIFNITKQRVEKILNKGKRL